MDARVAKCGVALAVTMALAVASRADAREPQRARGRGELSRGDERERREPAAVEHFRIGPLLGLGFPRPLALEGFAKFERLVGVGFEYSLLPRTSVMDVEAGFNALALDLRMFPFRGAFFIGARTGRQWLDAHATLPAGRLGSITESMEASTWFVNPRAGLLYTFRNGITLGIDAGVQLPISPSYARSGPATAAGLAQQLEIDGTLVAVANALGNRTTPTIDLFRLGFLF